jgi:topoisomerase-4 subunit B
VRLKKDDDLQEILAFYMGKNTPERQDFIIERLRVEEDPVEEVA